MGDLLRIGTDPFAKDINVVTDHPLTWSLQDYKKGRETNVRSLDVQSHCDSFASYQQYPEGYAIYSTWLSDSFAGTKWPPLCPA